MSWWTGLAATGKILLSLGLAALTTLVLIAVFQAQARSDLESDLDATEQREQATANQLEAAERELEGAESEIAMLQDTVDELMQELAGSKARAETIESDVSGQLRDAEQAVQDVLAENEELEALVAELTLAYSEEIQTALASLTSSLSEFACSWGREQAAAGSDPGAFDGDRIASAFRQTDEFKALSNDEQIQAALRVTEVTGEPFYGGAGDAIRANAVDCWQDEDTRINTAFYVHEDVLRRAALEAACTLGQDEVFGDFSQGFEDTATYADWELELGYEEAQDYLASIEDTYGSVMEFLAIPEDQLQFESDRCEDRRPMISPKSSATWNVGDEILVGTWNAYDVSDCYWARLAENGDIRDNHFGDALRISVNVLSSDAQFEISGCRFYFANP